MILGVVVYILLVTLGCFVFTRHRPRTHSHQRRLWGRVQALLDTNCYSSLLSKYELWEAGREAGRERRAKWDNQWSVQSWETWDSGSSPRYATEFLHELFKPALAMLTRQLAVLWKYSQEEGCYSHSALYGLLYPLTDKLGIFQSWVS